MTTFSRLQKISASYTLQVTSGPIAPGSQNRISDDTRQEHPLRFVDISRDMSRRPRVVSHIGHLALTEPTSFVPSLRERMRDMLIFWPFNAFGGQFVSNGHEVIGFCLRTGFLAVCG